MDQVSRPLQIALVATLAFAVLWAIALRPSDPEREEPLPGQTQQPAGGAAAPGTATQPGSSLPGGLGDSVQQANEAREQAEQAAGARAGEAPQTATTPSPSQTPAPAAGSSGSTTTTFISLGSPDNGAITSAGLAFAMFGAAFSEAIGGSAAPASATTAPGGSGAGRVSTVVRDVRRVQRAIAGGRVVVLLFWDSRSPVDRAVRAELGGVRSYGGRVLVVAAPVGAVSSFRSVTRDVPVLLTPTVVVIDPQRRAGQITGFTDAQEINQTVARALGLRR